MKNLRLGFERVLILSILISNQAMANTPEEAAAAATPASDSPSSSLSSGVSSSHSSPESIDLIQRANMGLFDIPTDVIGYIAGRLNLKDRHSASATCKGMRARLPVDVREASGPSLGGM